MRPTKLGALATVLGSSAFAMTLMACYGIPHDGSPGDYTGPAYGGGSDAREDGGAPGRFDGSTNPQAADAGLPDGGAGDAGGHVPTGDASLDASVDAAAEQDAGDLTSDAGADAAAGT